MLLRRILLLVGITFGCAAGAAASDHCCWCIPGTTTIYGSSGYSMASRCCDGRREYSCYNVGIPACYNSGWQTSASTGSEQRSRFSLLHKLGTAWR